MRTMLTPERAHDLLSRNIENNRRSSKGRVDRYANDMIHGRWRYNGEAIKIDARGRLIDGQQRLRAIIKANRPVDIEVIENLPVGIETSLDQGRVRSAGDALYMRSVPNPLVTGPTAKLVLNYLEGHGPKAQQTTAAVEEVLSAFPDIIYWATRVSDVRGVMPPSPLAAVLFLGAADGQRRGLAETFVDGVATGADLGQGDPRLALRTSIANNRGRLTVKRSIDTSYAVAVTTRAWNAWCENRSLIVTRYATTRAKFVTLDIGGAPRFGTGIATLRAHTAR